MVAELPQMWHIDPVAHVAANPASPGALPDRERTRLRREYKAAARSGFDLERTHRFVQCVRDAGLRWNERAGIEDQESRAVMRRFLVHSAELVASPVSPDRAADALFGIWGGAAGRGPFATLDPAPPRQEDSVEEHLAVYLAALSDVLLEGEAQASARQGLRAMRLHLDLSYDEVGRILGTSGETVRRWEQSRVAIPDGSRAQISTAHGHLNRLLSFFKPSRLPEVIRRPARIFDGRKAIDWILRGDLAEVVARYDVSLSYQS